MAKKLGKNITRVLGGDDLERVYLYNLKMSEGRKKVIIKKSNFSAAKDMGDVIMRHIGRYGLVLPYIRPGYRILDFPCGSGLFLEILNVFGRFGKLIYEGRDIDRETITYCKKVYGPKNPWASFKMGDLTNFKLRPKSYETISCIEGIEHINKDAQIKACQEFFKGLKKGGTFILSSPEPENKISGPNPKNSFHLWEMNKNDLYGLLKKTFKSKNIEIISQTNKMSTGQSAVCYYAICHKD